MTRIINGQIVDSHYGIIYISHVYIYCIIGIYYDNFLHIGEAFTKSELFDSSRRENRQLLHDTNNIIQDCYENPPIITSM